MKTVEACLKCNKSLTYTYDCQYGTNGVVLWCAACDVVYYGAYQELDEDESIEYEWPPQCKPQKGRKFWCYRFLGVSAVCCSVVDSELQDTSEGDRLGDKYENVPFLQPDEDVHYFDLSLTPCGYVGCYSSGSFSFWENERGEMIKRQY